MATHITTLVENHQDNRRTLEAEHGISFYIQHNSTTILFDTGQSDRFLHNADALDVDLTAIDHVVLSHSHYDHTNGLPFLLPRHDRFTLHVHEAFFDRKYAADGDTLRYIGPSWDRAWARRAPCTLAFTTGTGSTLAPGVHIVTGFAATHPLEVANPRFVVERGGTAGEGDRHTDSSNSPPTVDDFRDEQCIVLETDPGLVVLVGCSHPGIMNILDTIRTRFDEPIHAVLGGTHLIEAQGARLEEAIEYLSDERLQRVGLSHCTGDAAMKALSARTDRYFANVTGTVFSVP